MSKYESTISPFDFVNAIHERRNIITDEWSEKQYNPYLINRALSFGHDTIIPANEMNCRAHLDKRLQNTFLINIVQPRKRYNKWLKPEKLENLELVQQYYGYSIKKARHVLALLNDSQIKTIKEKLFKGGL
jgi:hypothetical protein